MKKNSEIIKKDAEVVTTPTVDERTIKYLEKIAEKAIINLEKRDYRATMVHREESGQIPDDIGAFLHIDEATVDLLGLPADLDVKGTITPFEAMQFQTVTYALALSRLEDWMYIKQKIEKPNGEIEEIQVPVNLAMIDMQAKKKLNLGVFGNQSNKHIKALRAGSGKPPEENQTQKAAGWFGFIRRRKDKSEMEQAYGIEE